MGCFTACRPAFLLQLVVHSYPACPLNYPPPCLTSASDGLGTPTHLHVTKGGGGIGAIDSEDKRRCGRVAIAAKNCRRHRLGGFFDRIDHDNVSLGATDQRQSEPVISLGVPQKSATPWGCLLPPRPMDPAKRAAVGPESLPTHSDQTIRSMCRGREHAMKASRSGKA